MILHKLIHKIKSVVANYELHLLKKRAGLAGYELKRKEPVPVSEIVVENYFKTGYKKTALLSYVVYPFLGKIENYHSNNQECFTIAEILKELEYNVDVIHWNNASYLPIKEYEVVIDNHNNLERLSPYLKSNSKKIFHATNAHWLYQNWIEHGRNYEFFLNRGIAISPNRLMSPGNSAEYCDVISMFGNEFTRGTYGKYSGKIHHVPMSVTSSPKIVSGKKFSSSKKKFIWINSHGALLKGLDIVLEAFSKVPHLELYVCADLSRDGEFRSASEAQLSKSENIKLAGWVDVESDLFKKIIAECAWVVSASFSEGGGGSILNCMAKGLIPVISKSSSITLPEKTGFYLEKNDAVELADLANKVSLLPDEELKERSFNAYSFVAANHTIENFKNKYKEFLVSVLS